MEELQQTQSKKPSFTFKQWLIALLLLDCMVLLIVVGYAFFLPKTQQQKIAKIKKTIPKVVSDKKPQNSLVDDLNKTGWKRYRNVFQGYEVSYPASWQAMQQTATASQSASALKDFLKGSYKYTSEYFDPLALDINSLEDIRYATFVSDTRLFQTRYSRYDTHTPSEKPLPNELSFSISATKISTASAVQKDTFHKEFAMKNNDFYQTPTEKVTKINNLLISGYNATKTLSEVSSKNSLSYYMVYEIDRGQEYYFKILFGANEKDTLQKNDSLLDEIVQSVTFLQPVPPTDYTRIYPDGWVTYASKKNGGFTFQYPENVHAEVTYLTEKNSSYFQESIILDKKSGTQDEGFMHIMSAIDLGVIEGKSPYPRDYVEFGISFHDETPDIKAMDSTDRLVYYAEVENPQTFDSDRKVIPGTLKIVSFFGKNRKSIILIYGFLENEYKKMLFDKIIQTFQFPEDLK